MMLIIMDKNPIKASKLVPDKVKFKQLIELGQLICSAGISNVYKKIPQGKELQEWIFKNPYWINDYFNDMFCWCILNRSLKSETKYKLLKIRDDLLNYCLASTLYKYNVNMSISTAIFRYMKEYKSEYPSNSELPINIACQEYKKYIEWKKSHQKYFMIDNTQKQFKVGS